MHRTCSHCFPLALFLLIFHYLSGHGSEDLDLASNQRLLHSIVFVTKRPGGYDILLHSLSKQTSRQYELICVDELAVHRREKVEEMAAALGVNLIAVTTSKPKTHPHTRFGIANAFNTGFVLASGDIVTVLQVRAPARQSPVSESHRPRLVRRTTSTSPPTSSKRPSPSTRTTATRSSPTPSTASPRPRASWPTTSSTTPPPSPSSTTRSRRAPRPCPLARARPWTLHHTPPRSRGVRTPPHRSSMTPRSRSTNTPLSQDRNPASRHHREDKVAML